MAVSEGTRLHPGHAEAFCLRRPAQQLGIQTGWRSKPNQGSSKLQGTDILDPGREMNGDGRISRVIMETVLGVVEMMLVSQTWLPDTGN